MTSTASVLKNHLAYYIKKQDFIIMLSYTCCICLNKYYIKLSDSDHYRECIYCNSIKYKKALLLSATVWSYLIQAQHLLCKKEETALNKLLYLYKQDQLFEKCAGDFLQYNIKKISELEELDYTEEEN
jgi:hypothetical protein